MSEVTSGLGVVVKTGEASAELEQLRLKLMGAATGVAALGAAVSKHAASIQSFLSGISRGGFKGLSAALDADINKATRSIQTFQQKMREGFTAAGLGAGKAFATPLNSGVKAAGDAAVRQAQELNRKLEKEAGKASGLIYSGSVSTKIAAGPSVGFRQKGGDVGELARNMVAGQEAMQAALARAGIQTAAQAREAAAATKLIKQQEAADWARYEKEKLDGQRLLHKIAVAEVREAAAATKLIKQQEAADWARYEKEKLREQKQTLAQWVAAEKAASAQVLAIRREYVGRTGSLGGFATATATKPIREFKSNLSASSALQAQRDNTLDNIDKSSSKLKAWSSEARFAHDTARGLSGALGGLWLTYGQLAPIMAGFAVASTLKGAFTASKDFAYQMQFVGAVTGDTAKQIDAASDSLLRMAKSSLFKPLELASGMRILAQAGMSTSQALETLPTVMALATVGETDLATAAETATGIMHAFGLEVKDIAHIGDVIAKAAAISTTSVAQMSESMKQASTVAQQYDLHLVEVSASLVALAERNITGQAAGTAFRNMMNELSNPTEKAQRALDILGVSLYDNQGNTKDLTQVMNELRTAMGKFDKQSQNLLGGSIFGERGNKPFQAIIAKTPEEWAGMVAKLEQSNGFLTQSVARLEDTVEGQFKNMAANAQASLIEIGKSSEAPLKELARTLTAVFTDPQVIGGIKAIASGVVGLTGFVVQHVAVLGTIVGGYLAFKAAGLAVAGVAAVFVGFAKVHAGLTVALAAAATAGRTLASVFGLLRTGQVALTAAVLAGSAASLKSAKATAAATLATHGGIAATAAATSATNALKLALLANPLGAITALVLGLATAYLTLRDNTNGAAEAARNAETAGRTAIDLLDQELVKLRKLNAEKERKLGLRPPEVEEAVASVRGRLAVTKARIQELQSDPLTAVGQKITSRFVGSPRLDAAYRLAKSGVYGEAIAKADDLDTMQHQLKVLQKQLRQRNLDATREGELEQIERIETENGIKGGNNVGTAKVTAEQLNPTGTGSGAAKTALTEARNMEKEHLQARIQQAKAAGETLLDELKHQQDLGRIQETEFNKRSFEIKEQALLNEYNLNLAYYEKMKKLGKGSEAKDALTKVEASSIAIGENRREYRQTQELVTRRESVTVRDYLEGIEGVERGETFQRELQQAPDYLKGFYTEQERIIKETQTLIDRAEQQGQALSAEAQERIWGGVAERLAKLWEQVNQMGPERLKSMMDEFNRGVAAKAQELDANVSIGKISKEAARDQLNAFIRESGKELLKLSKTDLTKLIGSMNLSATAAAEFRANLAGIGAQVEAASKTSAFDGLIAGVKSYGDNVGSVFENMKSLSESTFKSMEDALAQYVMTGKLDFKSLVRTVLEGLARIAAQQALMTAVEAIGGGSKGKGGSGGGIDWGGIVKTVGSWIFSAQGNVFTGTTGLSRFTNSIVSQPTAFAFAKGGVPNMGVMGEKPGSPGEAIMPLTRMPGGDLGVKVMGAGGSNAASTIAVSITVNDNRTQTETKQSGDSQTGKRLADMVQSAVYTTITKEMRPGGILA